jgi:hypothetical protein
MYSPSGPQACSAAFALPAASAPGHADGASGPGSTGMSALVSFNVLDILLPLSLQIAV